MCGRYLTKDERALERELFLDIRRWPHWTGSYNIAPTQPAPVAIHTADGNVCELMRFGLVPYFAHGQPPKYSTINARIENLTTGPSWRGPWERSQRCLVLASGFYEWHVLSDGKTKHPNAFRQAYPDVVLEVSLDDAIIDLVAAGYDAGIRLGESVERDMVAIRLTPEITWSVVGAPSYLAKTGRPKTPEELVRHQAIRYRFLSSQTLHRWGFKRGKREFLVDVKGGLIVNDRGLLIEFAIKGLGLAYVSDRDVQSHVAEGRLEPLLRSYIPSDAGLYLYFPEHSQTQLKLRVFIDMVRKMTVQPLGVKTEHAPPVANAPMARRT